MQEPEVNNVRKAVFPPHFVVSKLYECLLRGSLTIKPNISLVVARHQQ